MTIEILITFYKVLDLEKCEVPLLSIIAYVILNLYSIFAHYSIMSENCDFLLYINIIYSIICASEFFLLLL